MHLLRRLPSLINSIILGISMVLFLYFGVLFVIWGIRAVTYPFELDYGEGPILSQTQILMSGHSIYHNPDIFPYTIGNYPPLYHYVSGAISLVFKPVLAVGRSVSALASISIAAVIGIIVSTWAKTSKGIGLFPPVIAGLAFLATRPVFFWGVLMRVDMLAILFSIAGVCLYLKWHNDSRKVYIALLLFLLAAYTKQSTIAGAAACLFAEICANPKRGLKLTAAFAAAGFVVFGLINLLTHGEFYFHLVKANQNAFSWNDVHNYFRDLRALHGILILISLLGGLTCIVRIRKNLAAGLDIGAAIPVLYLISAFFSSLTIGKVGSSVNYLVELMAAISICAGIALVETQRLAKAAKEQSPLRALATTAVVILVPLALILQAHKLEHTPSAIVYGGGYGALKTARDILYPKARINDWVWFPDSEAQARSSEVLARIINTDGPVISELMTYLPLAEKPIVFQPFELTQLTYERKWDQTELINRIWNGEFPLIMLQFDVNSDPGWRYSRFTPEVVDVIRERYQLSENIGDLWLYIPR